jgi:hypothetical protein
MKATTTINSRCMQSLVRSLVLSIPWLLTYKDVWTAKIAMNNRWCDRLQVAHSTSNIDCHGIAQWHWKVACQNDATLLAIANLGSHKVEQIAKWAELHDHLQWVDRNTVQLCQAWMIEIAEQQAVSCQFVYIKHTHTNRHTHTQRDRETERERDRQRQTS